MKSHLLVIQDKAELDFLQSSIQDGIYFWIGLNISHPQNTWSWLDGTPLNLTLSPVKCHLQENTSVTIVHSRLNCKDFIYIFVVPCADFNLNI
uniref:Uncharacterized protein n=2 Tax=Ovis TaxID=9935 RepID=A0AC11EC52_SHEEP